MTDDLDRLLAAAHERGLRVLLDGVFNHVGRTHPAFRQVEAEGPDADTAALFRIDWDGWSPGDPVRADVFEGHEALVALDHDSPAVVEWVAEVMEHWLERGVDGWRLDAAYAVPPAFWAQVLPRVRERHPDAWFLGEVIHGDAQEFAGASTIDSLTAYELWQGVWHGIVDRNLFELAHAVERHAALLETFVPATFVGNHDVTRIASAVGPDLVPHALAVLFTVGGVPSVYAGDEDGATGVKEERLGGDDAVRPELPSTPPHEDDLDEAARTIRRVHQQLIGLRRREPWLVTARTDVVHTANEQLVLRSATADAAIVVALNIGDEPAAVPCADATEVVAGAGDLDVSAHEVRLRATRLGGAARLSDRVDLREVHGPGRCCPGRAGRAGPPRVLRRPAPRSSGTARSRPSRRRGWCPGWRSTRRSSASRQGSSGLGSGGSATVPPEPGRAQRNRAVPLGQPSLNSAPGPKTGPVT